MSLISPTVNVVDCILNKKDWTYEKEKGSDVCLVVLI